MAPKKGDPGYEEYRKAYNERRNRRRQDPEYVARFNARKRKQYRRRKEAEAADE